MAWIQSTLALLCALACATAAYAQTPFDYDFTIQPLDSAVNSPYDDYAPFLTSNEKTLFFTSYRPYNTLGEADIYSSRALADGRWTDGVNMGAIPNTDENDGAISIAADGKTIVFASEGFDDGYGGTDIYIGELRSGKIINIQNLGRWVNTKYWESQPTITGDGTTIYFISDRPDGIGETDIWKTTLDIDSTWTEPENLGPGINTEEDDRSPAISRDGKTLFFASNGYFGYGGFDFYMTAQFNSGVWRTPVNLGSRINSASDELFFYAPPESESFLFASNRPGAHGGFDIYTGFPNVFGNGTFTLTVNVVDSITGAPIPGIVEIVDLSTGNTAAVILTNSQTLDYSQTLPANREYRIEAKVKGRESKVRHINATEPNTTTTEVFRFGSFKGVQFDLGDYNIPFFVTGYYRPNTAEVLDTLLRDLRGPLKRATYIERFPTGSKRHGEYMKYSETVEKIFGAVYDTATRLVFTRFKAEAQRGEELEISVTGYADPQEFIGQYLESDEVAYVDTNGVQHTVRQGDRIENPELSGLRAWYSGHYLDKLFSEADKDGFPEYSQLKALGRIKYRYIGASVADDKSNYDAQRRIRISINRVNEKNEVLDTKYDMNTDFK